MQTRRINDLEVEGPDRNHFTGVYVVGLRMHAHHDIALRQCLPVLVGQQWQRHEPTRPRVLGKCAHDLVVARHGRCRRSVSRLGPAEQEDRGVLHKSGDQRSCLGSDSGHQHEA